MKKTSPAWRDNMGVQVSTTLSAFKYLMHHRAFIEAFFLTYKAANEEDFPLGEKSNRPGNHFYVFNKKTEVETICGAERL